MGAGDTLTGCVSTPSSEALDQVSDLRHSRTLPKRVGGIISNDNATTNAMRHPKNQNKPTWRPKNCDNVPKNKPPKTKFQRK